MEGSSINCTNMTMLASWHFVFSIPPLCLLDIVLKLVLINRLHYAVLDHPKKCSRKGFFKASINLKSTVQKAPYNAKFISVSYIQGVHFNTNISNARALTAL